MQEPKRGEDGNTKAQKPDADATSKETLSGVRENEKQSATVESNDPGPSPDGALDESDESKDEGPM